MKKIILMLAMATALFACQKEETFYPTLQVIPTGADGTPYTFKLYQCYNPREFNVLDTTQEPNGTFTGVSHGGDAVDISMMRDEFFYVIGYRDTVSHIDSVSTATGWKYFTVNHRFIFVNRHGPSAVNIPATTF